MGLFQRLRLFFQRFRSPGGSEFLCDTCMYDHPSACHRKERPNARVCPDYKRKGS